MTVTETKLTGVLIIEPQVFGDNRGWFMETYSKIKLPQLDCEFVQDNHSYSAKKGTVRGIHFQKPPMQQAKLVRCTRGVLLDFAVDLRLDSPTYKQWLSVELSAENKKQIFLPCGFGHGFVTLTDDVEIQYKTSNYYDAKCDGAVLWSDPDIGIVWGVENPIVSDKDAAAPLLKDLVI